MKAKESSLKNNASTSRKASSIRATKSYLINPDDLAEPFVALPPDGGWGWVVVAASFMAMFCVDGVGYCFAIFFQDISNDFNCEITDVALTSSLLGGFYYLSGPLTCSAINRYGFQAISVLGGIIAILAFTSASYMKSILPFTILVGFCGGTAFNLIYTPSVIAIGFYFERWRALAMAVNCCGSSLGVMCLPFIMTHFFENYSWRTKFKILAGVFGFCGLLGFSYKPIKTTKIERNVQFGEVSSRVPSTVTIETERELAFRYIPEGLTGIFQRFRNAFFPTISEVSVYSSRYGSRAPSRYDSKTSGLGYGYFFHRRPTADTEAISTFIQIEMSDENIDNKSVLVPVHEEDYDDEDKGCCKKFWGKCSKYGLKFENCSPCCKRKIREESLTNINRPMYRDDIFFTGSIYVLSQYSRINESRTSRPTIQRGEVPPMYTLSVSRAPTQRDLLEQNQCVCCPEAFIRVLATMLHFQMLKSPTFILLLISGYLSLMGTYICYIYVAERAVEMGIEQNSATMLLSILGISNTFGRAMCGVVSCCPTDINIISWVSIGICGIITLVSVFLTTMTGQIIFCSIFGFTIAAFAVLRAIMFVELFGIENLTNCFGLNMILQSAAAFSGVPIANYLYQSTKSFATPFIFTGVAVLLSAILLIPIRCILKWEQKKKTVSFDS